MNLPGQGKSLLVCFAVILLVFVLVSLMDVLLAVLYIRFYTTATLIVSFAVGGIFAGVLGYMYGIKKAPAKNEMARWSLIILILITGLLFFLVLAKTEGGEYEAAFKAFGATLSLSGFLFMKGKID